MKNGSTYLGAKIKNTKITKFKNQINSKNFTNLFKLQNFDTIIKTGFLTFKVKIAFI